MGHYSLHESYPTELLGGQVIEGCSVNLLKLALDRIFAALNKASRINGSDQLWSGQLEPEQHNLPFGCQLQQQQQPNQQQQTQKTQGQLSQRHEQIVRDLRRWETHKNIVEKRHAADTHVLAALLQQRQLLVEYGKEIQQQQQQLQHIIIFLRQHRSARKILDISGQTLEDEVALLHQLEERLCEQLMGEQRQQQVLHLVARHCSHLQQLTENAIQRRESHLRFCQCRIEALRRGEFGPSGAELIHPDHRAQHPLWQVPFVIADCKASCKTCNVYKTLDEPLDDLPETFGASSTNESSSSRCKNNSTHAQGRSRNTLGDCHCNTKQSNASYEGETTAGHDKQQQSGQLLCSHKQAPAQMSGENDIRDSRFRSLPTGVLKQQLQQVRKERRGFFSKGQAVDAKQVHLGVKQANLRRREQPGATEGLVAMQILQQQQESSTFSTCSETPFQDQLDEGDYQATRSPAVLLPNEATNGPFISVLLSPQSVQLHQVTELGSKEIEQKAATFQKSSARRHRQLILQLRELQQLEGLIYGALYDECNVKLVSPVGLTGSLLHCSQRRHQQQQQVAAELHQRSSKLLQLCTRLNPALAKKQQIEEHQQLMMQAEEDQTDEELRILHQTHAILVTLLDERFQGSSSPHNLGHNQQLLFELAEKLRQLQQLKVVPAHTRRALACILGEMNHSRSSPMQRELIHGTWRQQQQHKHHEVLFAVSLREVESFILSRIDELQEQPLQRRRQQEVQQQQEAQQSQGEPEHRRRLSNQQDHQSQVHKQTTEILKPKQGNESPHKQLRHGIELLNAAVQRVTRPKKLYSHYGDCSFNDSSTDKQDVQMSLRSEYIPVYSVFCPTLGIAVAASGCTFVPLASPRLRPTVGGVVSGTAEAIERDTPCSYNTNAAGLLRGKRATETSTQLAGSNYLEAPSRQIEKACGGALTCPPTRSQTAPVTSCRKSEFRLTEGAGARVDISSGQSLMAPEKKGQGICWRPLAPTGTTTEAAAATAAAAANAAAASSDGRPATATLTDDLRRPPWGPQSSLQGSATTSIAGAATAAQATNVITTAAEVVRIRPSTPQEMRNEVERRRQQVLQAKHHVQRLQQWQPQQPQQLLHQQNVQKQHLVQQQQTQAFLQRRQLFQFHHQQHQQMARQAQHMPTFSSDTQHLLQQHQLRQHKQLQQRLLQAQQLQQQPNLQQWQPLEPSLSPPHALMLQNQWQQPLPQLQQLQQLQPFQQSLPPHKQQQPLWQHVQQQRLWDIENYHVTNPSTKDTAAEMAQAATAAVFGERSCDSPNHFQSCLPTLSSNSLHCLPLGEAGETAAQAMHTVPEAAFQERILICYPKATAAAPAKESSSSFPGQCSQTVVKPTAAEPAESTAVASSQANDQQDVPADHLLLMELLMCLCSPKTDPSPVELRDVTAKTAAAGGVAVSSELECVEIDDPQHPLRLGTPWNEKALASRLREDAAPIPATHKVPVVLGEVVGRVTVSTNLAANDGSSPRFGLSFSPEAILSGFVGAGVSSGAAASPLLLPAADCLCLSAFFTGRNRGSAAAAVRHFEVPRLDSPAPLTFQQNCELHTVYVNGWPHFVLTSIPGVAVKAGDFLFADLGPRLFARLRQRLWQQAALRLVELGPRAPHQVDTCGFEIQFEQGVECVECCLEAAHGDETILCCCCGCLLHLRCTTGRSKAFSESLICQRCEGLSQRVHEWPRESENLTMLPPHFLNKPNQQRRQQQELQMMHQDLQDRQQQQVHQLMQQHASTEIRQLGRGLQLHRSSRGPQAENALTEVAPDILSTFSSVSRSECLAALLHFIITGNDTQNGPVNAATLTAVATTTAEDLRCSCAKKTFPNTLPPERFSLQLSIFRTQLTGEAPLAGLAEDDMMALAASLVPCANCYRKIVLQQHYRRLLLLQQLQQMMEKQLRILGQFLQHQQQQHRLDQLAFIRERLSALQRAPSTVSPPLCSQLWQLQQHQKQMLQGSCQEQRRLQQLHDLAALVLVALGEPTVPQTRAAEGIKQLQQKQQSVAGKIQSDELHDDLLQLLNKTLQAAHAQQPCCTVLLRRLLQEIQEASLWSADIKRNRKSSSTTSNETVAAASSLPDCIGILSLPERANVAGVADQRAAAAAMIADSSLWLARLAQKAPPGAAAVASAFGEKGFLRDLAVAALRCRLLSGHSVESPNGLQGAADQAAKTWKHVSHVLLTACNRRRQLLRAVSFLLQKSPQFLASLQRDPEQRPPYQWKERQGNWQKQHQQQHVQQQRQHQQRESQQHQQQFQQRQQTGSSPQLYDGAAAVPTCAHSICTGKQQQQEAIQQTQQLEIAQHEEEQQLLQREQKALQSALQGAYSVQQPLQKQAVHHQSIERQQPAHLQHSKQFLHRQSMEQQLNEDQRRTLSFQTYQMQPPQQSQQKQKVQPSQRQALYALLQPEHIHQQCLQQQYLQPLKQQLFQPPQQQHLQQLQSLQQFQHPQNLQAPQVLNFGGALEEAHGLRRWTRDTTEQEQLQRNILHQHMHHVQQQQHQLQQLQRQQQVELHPEMQDSGRQHKGLQSKEMHLAELYQRTMGHVELQENEKQHNYVQRMQHEELDQQRKCNIEPIQLYCQRRQRQRRQLLQQRSRRRERMSHGSTTLIRGLPKRHCPSIAAAADLSDEEIYPQVSERVTTNAAEVYYPRGPVSHLTSTSGSPSCFELNVARADAGIPRGTAASEAATTAPSATAHQQLAEAEAGRTRTMQELRRTRKMRALRCMLAHKGTSSVASPVTAADTAHRAAAAELNDQSVIGAKVQETAARSQAAAAASGKRTIEAVNTEDALQELPEGSTVAENEGDKAAATQRACNRSPRGGLFSVSSGFPHCCYDAAQCVDEVAADSKEAERAETNGIGVDAETGESSVAADKVTRKQDATTTALPLAAALCQEQAWAADAGQEDKKLPMTGQILAVPAREDAKSVFTAPSEQIIVASATGEDSTAAAEERIAVASAAAEDATAAAAALLDRAPEAPEVAAAAAATAATDALLLSPPAVLGPIKKPLFLNGTEGLLAVSAASAAGTRRAKRMLPAGLTQRRRIFAYCCRETMGDGCACIACTSCRRQPPVVSVTDAATEADYSKRCAGPFQLQEQTHRSLRSRKGRYGAATREGECISGSNTSRRDMHNQSFRKKEKRKKKVYYYSTSDRCSISCDSSSGSDWEGSTSKRKRQPQNKKYQEAANGAERKAPPAAASVAAVRALRRVKKLAVTDASTTKAPLSQEEQREFTFVAENVRMEHCTADRAAPCSTDAMDAHIGGTHSDDDNLTPKAATGVELRLNQKRESPQRLCRKTSQQQQQRTGPTLNLFRVLRSSKKPLGETTVKEATETALHKSVEGKEPLFADGEAFSAVVPASSKRADETGLPASPDTFLSDPAVVEEATDACNRLLRSSCSDSRQSNAYGDDDERLSTTDGLRLHLEKRPLPPPTPSCEIPTQKKQQQRVQQEEEQQCEQEGQQQRRRRSIGAIINCTLRSGSGGTAAGERVKTGSVACAVSNAMVLRSEHDGQQRRSYQRHDDISALPLEAAPQILEDFRELVLSSVSGPHQREEKQSLAQHHRTRKCTAASLLAAAAESGNNSSSYNTPSKSSHDSCIRRGQSVRAAAAAVAAATVARLQESRTTSQATTNAAAGEAAAEIAKNITWNEKRRSYAAKIKGVSQPVWFAAKRRGVPQALQAAANLLVEDMNRRKQEN